MPFFTGLGYPSITVLYLPTALTVIFIELDYLVYQAQKQYGTRSLKGVVNYREPLPGCRTLHFRS